MDKEIVLIIAKANNANGSSFVSNTKLTYSEVMAYVASRDQRTKDEIFSNLSALFGKSLQEANNYFYLITLGVSNIKEGEIK